MTVTKTTTVLSGSRIEIDAPEFSAGQRVEITLRTPGPTSAEKSPRVEGIADFLLGRVASKSAEEWQEFEREFEIEKDAWDCPPSR